MTTTAQRNRERAQRIHIALDHYVKHSFPDSVIRDVRSVDDLIDLLTDIRHYCEWQGYDLPLAETTAQTLYLAELDEIEAQP